MNDDIIRDNIAGEYGGGIYLIQCPENTTTQTVTVATNVANISGGGYLLEYDADCKWTDLLNTTDNKASYGEEFATFSVNITFEWQIPSKFSR